MNYDIVPQCIYINAQTYVQKHVYSLDITHKFLIYKKTYNTYKTLFINIFIQNINKQFL